MANENFLKSKIDYVPKKRSCKIDKSLFQQ